MFILTNTSTGIPVRIPSPHSNLLVRLLWGGSVEEAVSSALAGGSAALAVVVQVPFHLAGTEAAPPPERQVAGCEVSDLESLAVASAW